MPTRRGLLNQRKMKNAERKMTNNEIDAIIAKACGWKCSAKGWWSHPTLPDNGGATPFPPEYCTDLNEMHEAEKTLDPAQQDAFAFHLIDDKHAMIRGCVYESSVFKCAHATARQRAEAFLKCIDHSAY